MTTDSVLCWKCIKEWKNRYEVQKSPELLPEPCSPTPKVKWFHPHQPSARILLASLVLPLLSRLPFYITLTLWELEFFSFFSKWIYALYFLWWLLLDYKIMHLGLLLFPSLWSRSRFRLERNFSCEWISRAFYPLHYVQEKRIEATRVETMPLKEDGLQIRSYRLEGTLEVPATPWSLYT